MSAYEQGEFDTLCGIYAVLNATKKVNKKVDSDNLFKKIIIHLNSQNKLVHALTKGTRKNTIESLLENVANQYVNYESPFKQNINIEDYWNEMRNFLKVNKKGSIIVNINGKTWSHWAVVKNIEESNEQRIIFKDAFIKKKGFKKSKCATKKHTKLIPHLIRPTHTFFITEK